MMKAGAYLETERYEEGLELSLAAQRQPNTFVWAYVYEVVALAYLDRIKEAGQALERIRSIKPDFNLDFVDSTLKQGNYIGRELYIDGLKKAGLQD